MTEKHYPSNLGMERQLVFHLQPRHDLEHAEDRGADLIAAITSVEVA